MLIPYKNAILSITSDNGGEFVRGDALGTEHQTISKKLKTDFFFANPYASWEIRLSEGFLWKTNIQTNLLGNISLSEGFPGKRDSISEYYQSTNHSNTT